MKLSTIRVVLADDHPVIIQGTQHELAKSSSFSVVGTAQDSTELIASLDQLNCDVLVSGYVMRGSDYGDGLALFSLIRRRYPKLRLVVLTVVEHAAILHSLMDLGIRCIVSKSDPTGHLTAAVRTAHTNGQYLSPRVAEIIASTKRRTRGPKVGASLSNREVEVVRFFISGMSINEIARRLNRSKKTISAQKSSAKLKLAIKRDVDLIRYAIENGLLMSSPIAEVESAELLPGDTTSVL